MISEQISQIVAKRLADNAMRADQNDETMPSPQRLVRKIKDFFGLDTPEVRDDQIIAAMLDYAERHIAHGGRLHHVTRHMVGLFQGVPGARRWRQILSSDATAHEAGPEVIERAYGEIEASTLAAQ